MKIKILTLSIFLSACTHFIPEHQRPEVAVPKSWVDLALDAPANASTATSLAWEQFFQDERLKKIISEALVYNHDLRKSALNVQLAQATYNIKRANEIPTIGANGAVSRSKNGNSIGEAYRVGLGISAFELDFFGRVKALSEEALHKYLQTLEAQDSAKLAIISAVAKAYHSYLIQQELVYLAEQVIHNREKSLRLLDLQKEAGLIHNSSVLGLESALESTRASLESARAGLRNTEHQLSLLIGKPIQSLNLPPASRVQMNFTPLKLPEIPASVLNRRPDIREAEWALRASNANIGVAKAQLYPSFSLTTSLGWVSSELGQLFEAGGFNWSLSPSISAPIFNREALHRNVEMAEIQQKMAIENYQSVVETAFYEVANALVTREALLKQYEAQLRASRASQKRLNLENTRLSAGVSTALELLDAQRDSYNQQQALLNTELLMLNNYVDLYISMGGGLVENTKIPNIFKEKKK